jgi:hypothetical protein
MIILREVTATFNDFLSVLLAFINAILTLSICCFTMKI